MKPRRFLLLLFWGLCCRNNLIFSQTKFWQQMNGTHGGSSVSFLITNTNGNVFALTSLGILRSNDHGNSWATINTGFQGTVFCLAVNKNGNIFAGTIDGSILRSTDNGQSWGVVGVVLNNMPIQCLAINQDGYLYAGTYSRGVFRSIDGGQNWTSSNTGLIDYYAQTIAINQNGHIFLSAFCCQMAGIRFGTIYRSINNGGSWKSTYVMPGYDTFIRTFATNPDSHIFAGTSLGVLRSMNNGESWTPVNAGLTNRNVLSFAIDSHKHLFTGTYLGGVFRSINNGENWVPFNSGLTDSIVFALAVDSSGYVFAGTSQQGIFRSLLPTTSVREITNTAPISFSLEQNYPNPFLSKAKSRLAGNPSTMIEFSVPHSDYVILKVYNTLGAEVATLVAENLSAGRHKAVWDAKGMTNGIYFYRLQATDLVQTRKLVLLQ